jgi:L-lactate dehydrogenase complex protein LldG
MSSRDEILGAVRRNQPAPCSLPDVPMFDATLPPRLETFKASVARMGGKVVELPRDADLDAFVRERFPDAREICSATPEVQGTRRLSDIQRPAELHDVDLGVVRARFGVAETGSAFLSESELGVNALGYLVQHFVILLDPDAILPNLHHAYRRVDFQEARYAVLMTGPSATADIEGILIHGAQGVRSLTVVLTAPR